jgi:hypothetical protein
VLILKIKSKHLEKKHSKKMEQQIQRLKGKRMPHVLTTDEQEKEEFQNGRQK